MSGGCSTHPFGCPAGNSRASHLTCNLHLGSDSRHSWEKPHPLLDWLGLPFHMAAPGVPAHVLVLKRHT